MLTENQLKSLALCGKLLQDACHGASYNAGWWFDPLSGKNLRDEVAARTRFGIALGHEKLDLIHSEVGEATEGWRKNAMDKHLPQHSSVGVEIADAVIRAFDFAGALQIDLGTIIADKLAYNSKREDHKLEARMGPGGKIS